MTMRIGILQFHVLARPAVLALAGLAWLGFAAPALAQGIDAGASDSLGDVAAVIPEVTGQGWITGRHEFLLDPEDPLRGGVLLR